MNSEGLLPRAAVLPNLRMSAPIRQMTIVILLLSSIMQLGCQPIFLTAPLTSTEQRDTTANSDLPRELDGHSAELLSAFFGLDNGLPQRSNAICPGAGGADGMPVIFSHELDVDTLQPGDFRVTTASGNVGQLICVTMLPAIDPGELRTVLLVGEYGSAQTDPPVTVEVVGNLHSIDNTVNFKGAVAEITPLEPGPTLILAETLPKTAWRLGRESDGSIGSSTGCPVEGVQQIVRVVWAGGVTTVNNEEPGDLERNAYSVTVKNADGSTTDITPFALGDLADNDNNHELCLDTTDVPVSVSFPAGYLTDPNNDLNPATTVEVIQR
jgi:hypothetical protein